MNVRNLIETFSEESASRLTGISKRQLRYWDSVGFFSPSLAYADRGQPYSRLYSFRDVVALKVLSALRNDEKISLQHLREVKDRLLELGEALWGETTLYVHKKRVVFVNPQTAALEEVVSGQGVLQIPLKVASENMREQISRSNQRAAENLCATEMLHITVLYLRGHAFLSIMSKLLRSKGIRLLRSNWNILF
jgi:DNA-binding transcriptional MerR regulator